MKFAATSFLLCFFALAILGFVGASQAMSYNVTCVGDAVHNTACPGDSVPGALSDAIRQLSGLKLFSLATSVSIFLLLSATYLLLTVFPALVQQIKIRDNFTFGYWNISLRPIAVRKRSWLSLLEKRDPYNI